MRSHLSLLLCGALAMAACGESRSTLPLEPEVAEATAVPGGTQMALRAWDGTLSGPSYITQSGTYTYQLCATGAIPPSPGLFAQISTSKDGIIYQGLVWTGSACRSANTYVSSSTPDFTVWGTLSDGGENLYLYGGVTVDIPTPPVSVGIVGDDEVAPNEECAWQAFASGGTPPYSYQWWGGLTGSTATIFGSLPQSSYIWVAVTDANAQADTAQILVDVDESYWCDW